MNAGIFDVRGSKPDRLNSFASEVQGRDAQPVDLTLAMINTDVYEPQGHKIGAWSPLTDEQLKEASIDPGLLTNQRAGFSARIYTDQQGHYILAFRGTNEGKDWIHNVRQGLGFEDAQYEQAIQLSLQARRAFGEELVLTGHSLGGGLAAAGSLITRSPAVTFNAAGLHDNTIEHLGLDPEAVRTQFEQGGQVRRYAVDHEILTGLQERNLLTRGLLPDAIGHKIELPDPHPIHGWKPLIPGSSLSHGLDLHGMDSVLESQHLAAQGSMTDAAHPANGMFNEALSGLRGIQPDTLGLQSDEEYRNAAGSLVSKAHEAGMRRIDHVVIGGNGALFAVEGPLEDARHRIASIDKMQAAAQSIETSSQLLHRQMEVEAAGQPQHTEIQRRAVVMP